VKPKNELIVQGINDLFKKVYGDQKIALVLVWSENAASVEDTAEVKIDLTTNMSGKTSPVYFLAQAIARIATTDPNTNLFHAN
jgi:hypothetical protein